MNGAVSRFRKRRDHALDGSALDQHEAATGVLAGDEVAALFEFVRIAGETDVAQGGRFGGYAKLHLIEGHRAPVAHLQGVDPANDILVECDHAFDLARFEANVCVDEQKVCRVAVEEVSDERIAGARDQGVVPLKGDDDLESHACIVGRERKQR